MASKTASLSLLACSVVWLACSAFASSPQVPETNTQLSRRAKEWPQALRIADFILSLQNAAGAIPDRPGVITVNEDSNMEYALIGLGAAYAATHNARYLDGLERGIKWLAAREEMTDPRWRGSWRYVYSANAPFAPIPTSAGPGITDVRGVDATSTLFVYLLYLHQRLTGSDVLVRTYEANAKAALDFVIHYNLDKDGFSRSSWQQHASDGQWHLYAFKYSADQGDVYLGMQAGALLYRSSEYERIAAFLRQATPRKLFANAQGRYGLGLDEKGALDPAPYVFAQGYLAWIWGNTAENHKALVFLRSKVRSDGGFVERSGKPASSLGVAVLSMADSALRQPEPSQALKWLTAKPFDQTTGGIRETAEPNSYQYNNVAGFCVIGLLGFLPFD